MSDNRFLAPRSTRGPRIALSCTARFPDPDQLGVYPEFAAFRDALEADLVIPHGQVSVDTKLPAELASLERATLFLQPHDERHRADFEHFRRALPERFALMVEKLTKAIGCTADELADRFEVLHACTYARYLRALDVEYIHTWYNYDQSLNACVASLLLGIPRGITLCEGLSGDDWDLRIPALHLEEASVVIAVSPGTRDEIEKVGGERALAKTVQTGGTNAPAEIAARVREAMAKSTRVPTGVDAAFHETHDRRRDPSATAVPYILLATERTGSNLLFEVLSLESAHELFNPVYKEGREIPIYVEALGEDLRRDEDLLRLRETDPPACIDAILHHGARGGLEAMGFKLMYFHGDIDWQVTDYLLNSEDFRVFHVLRRNRLERFLSFQRAEMSGSWYKTKRMKGEGGPKQAIELDAEAMLVDFAAQELLEQKYSALFRNHPMLELYYEDFSQDFDGTRRQAEELFGITLPNRIVRSRKTGKRTMRDGIANYEQVASALRSTRWESFLEE